jgi:hypothetical protein
MCTKVNHIIDYSINLNKSSKIKITHVRRSVAPHPIVILKFNNIPIKIPASTFVIDSLM